MFPTLPVRRARRVRFSKCLVCRVSQRCTDLFFQRFTKRELIIKTVIPMKVSTRSYSIACTLRLVILACSLLLVTGCAMTGAPTNDAGEPFAQIDIKDAQIDERVPLIAQGDALPASASVNVRWGGTVASVENLPDNITRLEIVSRPLSRSGRPIRDDRSSGRFIAEVAEFLDPEIVQVGRDVTVTGLLQAREPGLIGETEYLFPIVETDDYTVWQPQVVVRQNNFQYWDRPSRRYYDPFRRRWILRGLY